MNKPIFSRGDIVFLIAPIALAFFCYWFAPPPGFVLWGVLGGTVFPVIVRINRRSGFVALGVLFMLGEYLPDHYHIHHWPSSLVLTSAWLMGYGLVEFCLRPFFPGKEIERERRLKDAFENPNPTPSSDLPLEFRFITRETTLQKVMERIGPWSHKVHRGSVFGFEYDLPSGYAVLILPEPPCRPESQVRNVRMYLKTEERDLPD